MKSDGKAVVEMTDREKVIKGLERCIESDGEACPKECPFYKECLTDEMPYIPVIRAALELLKEQENSFNWRIYYCPKCGMEHYVEKGKELTRCDECGGMLKATGWL